MKKEEATGVNGARWHLRPCGAYNADGGEGCSRVDLGSTWARNVTGDGSGGGVEHHGLATVLDVEGDQESSTQHVEQVQPKRHAFSTSFRASNM